MRHLSAQTRPIQVWYENTKKSSRIPLPFWNRAPQRRNNTCFGDQLYLENPNENHRADFCDTSRLKRLVFRTEKTIAITDTFRILTDSMKKRRFHSRSVAKMKKGTRHPNKKPTFPKMSAQTRAALGVAHRTLENVTFERRERRVTHPPRAADSGYHSSRSWAKMTEV